ncbi:MAG: hypothetical protein JSW66_15070 [Phycisphaerales bacterium]|nr:MAG: hypothetical protein JSW66_15070 [Phycisphaerales bacterium]
MEQRQLTELRRILATRFDLGELRTLCFDLGIRYDDLSGEGAANKARELVAYLHRRGRIPQLIKVGKNERPDIPWDEILKVTDEARIGSPDLAPAEKDRISAILDEVVIIAEDYLTPQSLIVSDSIAELVRSSLRKANLVPQADDIAPYLRKRSAAYRVVGYLAFHAAATQGHLLVDLTDELVACLGRERREAIEPHKETRPLWQLLVCFTYLSRGNIEVDRKHLIQEALQGFHDYLRSDPTIDPGGQCKTRIKMLLSN